jgi:hypothetical protein
LNSPLTRWQQPVNRSSERIVENQQRVSNTNVSVTVNVTIHGSAFLGLGIGPVQVDKNPQQQYGIHR